jgi:hypothetical protein
LEAAIIPPASIPPVGKLAGQPRQGEMIESGNLFVDIPDALENEQFLDLFSAPGVKIERIVSTGHATPASEWLDQDWTEWSRFSPGRPPFRSKPNRAFGRSSPATGC